MPPRQDSAVETRTRESFVDKIVKKAML